MKRLLLLSLFATLVRAQTGIPVPSLAAVDTAVTELLAKHQIPGGAVAITYQGRLVYARGFGFADRDTRELVQPDSLFRYASNSKPITGLALLRLVDQGKLTLDDRPFANQLRNLPLPPNTVKNPAWDQVTVRQLLHHTAGMPPAGTGDPLNAPEIVTIANTYGTPPPGTMAQAIGTVLTRAPLSAPGTTYTYSNVGTGAVGRLIEVVSGKPYERFVQEDVLAPLGITRMALGASLASRRLPGEVRPHDVPGAALVNSIFPGVGRVEFPSGGYAHEAYEGAGAWVGSVPELLRLFSRFQTNQFLSPASLAALLARPPAAVNQPTGASYTLGISVVDRGNGRYTVFHNGSLPGGRSYFEHTFGGTGQSFGLAFNFNMRRTGTADFLAEAGAAITRAAFGAGTANFPTHDLWPRFIASERPQFATAGLVSAASFRTGPVAPGQIVTLFGSKLSGSALTTATVTNNRLDTTLDGTRVLFDGVPAPLIYTAASQLSAIVPYAVAGRPTTRITVEYQGAASLPVEVPVTTASPAFFTANSSGQGPAAAIRYPEAGIAVLYATGEGLPTPTPEDGALSLTTPLPAPRLPVKVFVAGEEVPILYVGAAPGLTAGLLQINIQLPPSLANRSDLPLILEIGGVRSPPGVTL
jgi:uncharacterized protein (TIGR03437 family)